MLTASGIDRGVIEDQPGQTLLLTRPRKWAFFYLSFAVATGAIACLLALAIPAMFTPPWVAFALCLGLIGFLAWLSARNWYAAFQAITCPATLEITALGITYTAEGEATVIPWARVNGLRRSWLVKSGRFTVFDDPERTRLSVSAGLSYVPRKWEISDEKVFDRLQQAKASWNRRQLEQ